MLKAVLLVLGALCAFGLLVGAIIALAPWISGAVVLVGVIWFSVILEETNKDDQT